MIESRHFVDKEWTYISRQLNANLSSCIEHMAMKSSEWQVKKTKATTSLDKFQTSELAKQLEEWMECLSIAKSEVDILLNFGRYLMVLDFEKTRVNYHIKYIYIENKWLLESINEVDAMLLTLESQCREAISGKKYYQCYYNMRNFTRQSMKMISQSNQDDDDSSPEEDVPLTLSSLFHLVTQFMSENRHLVASSWCKKNIVDLKRNYGNFSKEVGAVYNLLGRINKCYGAYSEAKEYFELSLPIRKKVFGENSDQVGITLSLLGSTLGKLGDYKRGIEVCNNALTIREKIYGKNNEVCHLYANIAEFSAKLNRWNDVITNYQICIAVFDNLYDETATCIINGYTSLALAYTQTNELNNALECLTNVNRSYVLKNNPGSSSIETPLSVIAESLKEGAEKLKGARLFEMFGTISDPLGERLVDVMMKYYEKTKAFNAIHALKGWSDLSNINAKRPSTDSIFKPRKRMMLKSSAEGGSFMDSISSGFLKRLMLRQSH